MKLKAAIITTVILIIGAFLLATPIRAAKFCQLRANYCDQSSGFGDCRDRNLCSEWVDDWENCDTVLENKCQQYYPLPLPNGWDECQRDSDCEDPMCGWGPDEYCLAPGACSGPGCYSTGRPCIPRGWVCCAGCQQEENTPTPRPTSPGGGPTSTPGGQTPTPTPTPPPDAYIQVYDAGIHSRQGINLPSPPPGKGKLVDRTIGSEGVVSVGQGSLSGNYSQTNWRTTTDFPLTDPTRDYIPYELIDKQVPNQGSFPCGRQGNRNCWEDQDG